MQAIAFAEYFPDCCLPDCPDSTEGESHQHILPHQKDILDCETKYLYCQGGVGSAKSLAFAIKAVWLSLSINNNRGVVSRLHYDDLFDSSWREIKSCLNRLVEKRRIPQPEYVKKVQGDYTQIILHNGSEIKAVQGKNWSRGLGASHGWFWVDDALESQEQFFVGSETSAGLLSRLRLPEVHYDKQTYSTTRQHGSLHGMISSNPPPYGHWLHKLFGDKPGTYAIGQDTVTWMQTVTSDNPFVGADYAKGLIATQQKMGHNVNTVKRVIFGESIPAYGGTPVFPQFEHSVHVAPLKFKPELPLIRAWDFGHDHPAVIFANIYRCAYGTNHYFTLSEVSDAFNVTVYQLYDNYVVPHTKALYSAAKLIRDCGDRAGYRSSSSNKDNRSDMKILMAEYKLAFRWKFMNLKPSLQYIRSLLKPKEPCRCKLPLTLISDKCKVLIGALEGGYRFSKSKTTGAIGDKPIEDKYFSDVACAYRYGAENFVKWEMDFSDKKELIQKNRQSFDRFDREDTAMGSWLNDTDRAVIERLNPGYFDRDTLVADTYSNGLHKVLP